MIAQYKKSNILRREFSKRWLQADNNDVNYRLVYNKLRFNGVNSIYGLVNVKIFNSDNLALESWYCPESLKGAFQSNKMIVFDGRGNLDKVYIEFLKDFNSYFDLILCDRLSVSSQIIGTLWSEKIIWTPLLV